MTQQAAALGRNAEGMGSIVDDLEIIVVRNFLNGRHVAGLPVTMYWQDSRRLRGDRRLDLRRIEIERFRLDINEDRFNAIPQKRVRSSNKRIGRRDYLAGNAQCLQGSHQAQGAIGKQ